MKQLALIAVLASGLLSAAFTQEKELNGDEILKKVDDVLYASKDKDMQVRFVLIDKNGKESVRDMVTLEKGPDKRLMKFTAPADQKGIGFLSLPDEVMYVYLPAFGKTRRIASHVKNTKFAGTDLTYENLEAKRYSDSWNAKLTSQDSEFYVLELAPKPKTVTDYSKLMVKVKKGDFLAVKIDYFDKSGTNCKTMDRGKFEKYGNYWEATESVMTDLKEQHKTKLIMSAIKHDTNIPDDKFSERYLMR
ncbi:MAG TPA: outer membrane lipoprotein-sorting protein [Chitinivibrionales bacterium]|nr:outer membrane lipoprotein-sorting protein [Chitinivibrionales bacterium]